MEVLGVNPGPIIGQILNALLEEVMEDPSLNREDYLDQRVLELSKLSSVELKLLAEKGKEKKDLETERKLQEIRSKHHVQ
jgi:hypothetical protein